MSELASSLLRVMTYEKRENVHREGSVPLMMEFPVSPELAPFLVSSSKATLWVNPRRPSVKAATREIKSLTAYFWEVVRAVIMKGRALEWGNVHPLSKAGLQAAIDHVRSYDLSDLEVLAHPDVDWGKVHKDWEVEEGSIPLTLLGLPLQPAPWLPKSTVVVVPRDRDFVGFALLFQERVASVVHNASRGIGVATSWKPKKKAKE